MMTQAIEAEFVLTHNVSAFLWVLDNVTHRWGVRVFAEWTLLFASGC